MAIIKAFKGVRPKTELAQQVASLPYDVMNTAEAKEMAKGNPYSFLHVSRAEIDLPVGTDEHSQQVYDKAKETFYKMISDGVLAQDGQPLLYIYAQEMNGRKQFGLVACSSIDDYFNDVIKKHELTRPEKEQDRIEHMQTLQAHVGPIFLTYPKNNDIDAIVENVLVYQKPVYDFTADDNIQHRLGNQRKRCNRKHPLHFRAADTIYLYSRWPPPNSFRCKGWSKNARTKPCTYRPGGIQFLSVSFVP